MSNVPPYVCKECKSRVGIAEYWNTMLDNETTREVMSLKSFRDNFDDRNKVRVDCFRCTELLWKEDDDK